MELPTFISTLLRLPSVRVSLGNRRSLALVVVLFSFESMSEPDNLPAPETAEWTVGWTIKRALRMHLGPRHGYLPWMIARDVVAALRLSNWRITKGPPRPPHSTPGE